MDEEEEEEEEEEGAAVGGVDDDIAPRQLSRPAAGRAPLGPPAEALEYLVLRARRGLTRQVCASTALGT